ncbi:MAG: hypothetical protein ACK415_12025 [Thermodesulfovibrionales bacterium]
MKKGIFNLIRKNSLLVLYSLVVTIFLWGCGGGGPGSPGSSGTEDTGVIIDATVVPNYLGKDTYSVDVVRQNCGTADSPDWEPFTDHGATLTINARLVNPNTTFRVGTLYVERYTVEFRRSNDSVGAPPIESDTRYHTIVITPPTGNGVSTVETTVILVDLKRKEKYLNDMLSGQYTSGMAFINNYTATYTFYGKNEFGTGFSFKATTNFQIGSFDNCGG